MEWLLLAVVFTAFAIGVYAGAGGYRWRLHRAIRGSARRHPAVPQDAPIDHDAMLRIIKQHQGD